MDTTHSPRDTHTSKKNIAFFGTPELCIPFLEKLRETPYEPALIITNPDRPQGRKHSELIAPPVKKWAEDAHIDCWQPESISASWIEKISQEKDWDLFVVIAYGKILPKKLINLPQHGTINVHYSLLPRWRGATPVEAAILAGDRETGVSIQKMHYKLDAGPVIATEILSLDHTETSTSLRALLTNIGADLLVDMLPDYLDGTTVPQKQDRAQVTTCTLIQKSDGEVNLASMSHEELFRRYRAYAHWPGIFFFDTENNGTRVKITQAHLNAQGAFIIEKVIPAGSQETTWGQYQSRRND